MLMKVCRQCGRHLPQNSTCRCSKRRHILYNKTARDKDKNKFYHSRQWQAIVAKVKARANGLDEYALSLGYLEQGNTVHHIYTVDERPDLKLAEENLIYVSARTHNFFHAEYKRGDEVKQELQEDLMKITRAAGGQ